MRNLCFVFGLICTFFSVATGQSYLEPLRIDYTISPIFDDKDEVSNLERWYANINYATPLQPNKLLLLFNYEGRVLSFATDNEDIPTVYSNKLGLGTVHLWDDQQWKLILLAHAKINSDYQDISFEQDWQFGGSALLTKTQNADLAFSLGGYFNSEFFGPFFIPLLGVSWQAKPRLFVYVLVPQLARVEYALKPRKWYAGFQANLLVTSYRLSEALQNDYIEERTIDINVFLEYYFTKNLVVFVKTGYPARQQYKYFSENDVERLDAIFPFSGRSNLNLQAGLSFQIRQKN